MTLESVSATSLDPSAADDRRLSLAGLSCLVLGSGAEGHEANCLGLVRAIGLEARIERPQPRSFFSFCAPYGPADPGDPIWRLTGPPFPDIAIASGRRTAPYLRRLKRMSDGRTFCVFLQDPKWGRSSFDAIWAPRHDRLKGERVIVSPTPPQAFDQETLHGMRRDPHPWVAATKSPRLALLVGGPSRAYRYGPGDIDALLEIVRSARQAGFAVLATPSRRTPSAVVEALRRAMPNEPSEGFLWDGSKANPYGSMLANADCIVATADSVNMIGEALATQAPVLVFEPSGRGGKLREHLLLLLDKGLVRRWSGAFDRTPREPYDSTPAIAREVARRYLDFVAARGRARV